MNKKPITSPQTLAETNKQIAEIKKKIQLSEGQRKAAFEVYETERKQHADQILKLKKDIRELTIALQANKDENAQHRIKNTRLETLVGPLVNKTAEQVVQILDLQIIDQKKHLDLIRHKIKQKEALLANLAKEYQVLLADEPNKEITRKVDNPFMKKIYALQNSIHRVELQWNEADHVKKSYSVIRKSLQENSSRFESVLQQLEERLEAQQRDISDLQKINAEAAQSRATARLTLQREERTTMHSAKIRERQNVEYANLVAERKLELERLERKIFQAGKPAQLLPAVDIADDNEQPADEEQQLTPEKDQEDILKESFDKLKEVTGATNADDVLLRFHLQMDTKARLEFLKKNTEEEKRKLELKQKVLNNELERYKFAKEKDKEKHGDSMIELEQKIEEQEKRKENFVELLTEKQNLFDTICKTLYNLCLGVHGFENVDLLLKEAANKTSTPDEQLIEILLKQFEKLIDQTKQLQDEEALVEFEVDEMSDMSENEQLPSAYSTLLRQTPQPVPIQTGVPPVTVSEDEEEVPSRTFLKRQAQLVVDAKIRRKNIRIPVPRK